MIASAVVFIIFYVIVSSCFTSKKIVVIKEGEAISDSFCYQELLGRSYFGEFRQTVCRTKIKWQCGREEVDKLPFSLLKGEKVRFCKVITYYFNKIRITAHYEYRRVKL
ncbi:MAG: hypothetical protein GWO87_02880 [Xanthomonadaceae bacterium]|nr:hypothetical protein [Rhodospirillaceae bacterium]NIA18106.1 hypothetical protein [Xanthomonadaceae bacterium]